MGTSLTQPLRPLALVRRLVLYALPLAIFGVVVLLFLRMRQHLSLNDSDYAREHNAPLPVRVYRVDEAQLNHAIPAECIARPNPLVELRGRLQGRPVLKTFARVGDFVKAGTLLVVVDSQEEQLQAARANDTIVASKRVIEANQELLKYYQGARDQGFGLEKDVRVAGVELAKALATLSQAEAELRDGRAGMERAQLVTPVSGQVTQIHQPGEVAAAATDALVSVAVVDPLLLECTLPEEKVTFVRAGLPFEATFYGRRGDTRRGVVREVDALSKESERTVVIRGEVPNKDGNLLPGLHGVAQVQNDQRSLRVPSVALINPRSDAAEVFLIDAKDRSHLKQVSIGGSAGGYVQILHGLALGDRVVVAGQLGLRDNDRCRVTEDPPGAKP